MTSYSFIFWLLWLCALAASLRTGAALRPVMLQQQSGSYLATTKTAAANSNSLSATIAAVSGGSGMTWLSSLLWRADDRHASPCMCSLCVRVKLQATTHPTCVGCTPNRAMLAATSTTTSTKGRGLLLATSAAAAIYVYDDVNDVITAAAADNSGDMLPHIHALENFSPDFCKRVQTLMVADLNHVITSLGVMAPDVPFTAGACTHDAAAADSGSTSSTISISVCGGMQEDSAASHALQLHMQDMAGGYYGVMLGQDFKSATCPRQYAGIALAVEVVKDVGLPTECVAKVHERACTVSADGHAVNFLQ